MTGRAIKSHRVVTPIALAALLSSLSYVGFASTANSTASAAKEGLSMKTNIIALTAFAIVSVAAVRCWFLVRLAKQETPGLGSSRSSHSDLAPMTPL